MSFFALANHAIERKGETWKDPCLQHEIDTCNKIAFFRNSSNFLPLLLSSDSRPTNRRERNKEREKEKRERKKERETEKEKEKERKRDRERQPQPFFFLPSTASFLAFYRGRKRHFTTTKTTKEEKKKKNF